MFLPLNYNIPAQSDRNLKETTHGAHPEKILVALASQTNIFTFALLSEKHYRVFRKQPVIRSSSFCKPRIVYKVIRSKFGIRGEL